MNKTTTPVAIALGSNLGDRRGHLEFAIEQLKDVLDQIRVSRLRETEPVGVDGPQPPFLNAVLVGETALQPAELLEFMLGVERRRGRTRPYALAPRTLDLDLVLFADQVVDLPALQVPHPRFREREFVLEPLAELVPDWIDPVSGRSVGDLLRILGRRGS